MKTSAHETDNKAPPYSRYLWKTIRHCLSDKPSKRLSPDQLYYTTRDFAETSEEYVRRQRDQQCYEVWYEGNEINAMETGFFKPHRTERRFYNARFPEPDPANPHLDPPEMERFHPYESNNEEFFRNGNGDFRKHDHLTAERKLGPLFDVLEYTADFHRRQLAHLKGAKPDKAEEKRAEEEQEEEEEKEEKDATGNREGEEEGGAEEGEGAGAGEGGGAGGEGEGEGGAAEGEGRKGTVANRSQGDFMTRLKYYEQHGWEV